MGKTYFQDCMNLTSQMRISVLQEMSFKLGLNDPIAWYIQSIKLMKASRELRTSCPIESGLLASYAFEVILKAYIVADISQPFTSFPAELDGHNLDVLKNRTKTIKKLLPNENKLLKHMTNYVLWEGRYPIPKSKSHAKKIDVLNFDDVEKLWGKFNKKIPSSLASELNKLVSSLVGKAGINTSNRNIVKIK